VAEHLDHQDLDHCYVLWESMNKDKHGHDAETERAALLAQLKRPMAVMYELKNRCFPNDRVKWFHPTLEEHITNNKKSILRL
jgi:hypothetical protein